MNKFLGIVALACSLAFSQSLFASASFCGQGIKQMVESLKLSEEQKSKINPILEQLKTSVKDSVRQLRDLEPQFKQQIESATLDQSAVDSLVDKKTKLIGDMMKVKVAAKNQIFNILNNQQKAQLQDKIKNMEEKLTEQYKQCHEDD